MGGDAESRQMGGIYLSSNSLQILASIFWPDVTTCDLILNYLAREAKWEGFISAVDWGV